MYPVPDGHDPYGYELALTNLQAIWTNFLAAGFDRVVIAGTLLNQDQVEQLRAALDGIHSKVVLVTAQSEVRKRRIRERTKGALLADFLARTDPVEAEIRSAAIHDLTLINTDSTPAGVATDLLNQLDW
jgi:hypothetical protein